MQRGTLGCRNLNKVLQTALNPSGPSVERFGCTFRVGDKVMQMVNDYDMDVFNGDIGRVVGAAAEGQELLVDFYGSKVSYALADIDQLVLAYACSIHKAQGSEYPCVVIPLHSQHHIMLQRNLLYTAVTRGRQLVLVVGESKALAQAVRNDRQQMRYTRLSQRLAES